MFATVPASGGRTALLTLALEVPEGRVFLKATPLTHRYADTLEAEARVAPIVAEISPRLLHPGTAGGWRWLLFEHVQGRHADLSPASTDLGAVAEVLQHLPAVKVPDFAGTLGIEERWAHLAGDLDLHRLAGDWLVHTDLHAGNILVCDGGAAVLVDWARPGRGAGWLSSGFLLASIINAGTAPQVAESWARQTLPAWAAAPGPAVDIFVAALARRRAEQAEVCASWRRLERDGEFRSAQRWHAFRAATT
ncbi:phosphotransferase [Streptomyces sp. NPDC046915]|uniref:phosphotransferase n=1 Tax=Streptomyces sp. NPDC046915 TaxID=3155257 RepID=UPI0033EBA0E0